MPIMEYKSSKYIAIDHRINANVYRYSFIHMIPKNRYNDYPDYERHRDKIAEIFSYWQENCGGHSRPNDFVHFWDTSIAYLRLEEDLMMLKLRFG